jgi:tRNA (guanine10-N2)-dimethyltransferase
VVPPVSLVEVGGWHPLLPAAELAAVAGQPLQQLAPRLFYRRGELDWSRLAYAKRGLQLLGSSLQLDIPFDPMSVIDGSYAVRLHDPDHLLPPLARQRLIDRVWRRLPSPQVRLTNPDHDLHVYVTPTGLWWGQTQGRTGADMLHSHDPMGRPFFRSVLVPRRRARCLVNLTGVRPGQRLLDPFCGTGALLVEAGLLGAAAFGSDVDRAMVTGCRANLAFENVPADVRRIDARTLSDWGLVFDAVVTDLPYGRSASTHGVDLPDLFRAFLDAAVGVVREGARVVVMAPAGLPEPSNALFDVITVLRERVSRSLTREIWVLYRRSQRGTPAAAAPQPPTNTKDESPRVS